MTEFSCRGIGRKSETKKRGIFQKKCKTFQQNSKNRWGKNVKRKPKNFSPKLKTEKFKKFKKNAFVFPPHSPGEPTASTCWPSTCAQHTSPPAAAQCRAAAGCGAPPLPGRRRPPARSGQGRCPGCRQPPGTARSAGKARDQTCGGMEIGRRRHACVMRVRQERRDW